MNRVFIIFFLSLIVFSSNDLYCQEPDPHENSYSIITNRVERKLLDKAGKRITHGDYDAAIKKYADLLKPKSDSANPEYNYAMALTHYSNFQQPKSIFYFQRALRHSKDTIEDAYFFLADAFHLSGNYDKAERHYKIYLSFLERHGSFLRGDDKRILTDDVVRRIEMCGNGKYFSGTEAGRSPVLTERKKIQISDAGNNINSRQDDYGAVLCGDDSILFFTSRREDVTGRSVDFENKYSEDIYISRLKNRGWTPAENSGYPVNTKLNESILSVSPDGKRICFYTSINKGGVYYSDFINGHWNFPYALLTKSELENQFRGTNIFSFQVTASKDELYVVSNRNGGVGGRDIYVSKKMSDGSWGELENMGDLINTRYDEDTPSLSADGNTLYFSSNGHNSIGGFDVFVSYRKGGKWSQPVNLGVPVNTPGDDLFFSFLHKGNRAIYSSSGYASDNSRDFDIYNIDFLECATISESTINGVFVGVSTGTITVTDLDTKDEVGKYVAENGKYTMHLQPEKRYRFTVEINGIQPVHSDVTLPFQCYPYDMYQEIDFTKPGDPLIIKNAFFDIAKESANSVFTTYADYLKKADKSKLQNYSENSVPTKEVEIVQPEITTIVSDTIAGKVVTTFSFNNIVFDFDKSDITEIYKVELDKLLEFLSHSSPDTKLDISSHSDSKGTDDYNMALSLRRANSVEQYLESKGISKNRMTMIGYGETKPIAPNENADGTDNLEGMSKNRRTEIVIK